MTPCLVFILHYMIVLTTKTMSDCRVSILNINGAGDVRKRVSLFEFIKLKKTDVMLVQETHSKTLNETEWKKEWEGEVILSHQNRNSGGVALLLKNFLPESDIVEENV